MATKQQLIEVAETLGIETAGLTVAELNTSINDKKKALESIKTSEESPISRITRFTWWCPFCDTSMPNGGVQFNGTFLKGTNRPKSLCTKCGAEKTENKDGTFKAVNTR